MAEEVSIPSDIVEQILARLDVDDLIRCKLVCKSWLSLISDPFSVKTHLIHSHNKDCKNNETRRIVMEVCIPSDIVEQILARLDVDDLIRCKCVCKSWLSSISDPFFVKNHLIHSHNKDCKNNETRRIVMDWSPYGFYRSYMSCYSRYFILGSSNGLVCLLIADAKQILIAKPSTRQVEQHLPAPPINIPYVTGLCSGFGYDFLTDDYKVIVGDHTCFQVLSLKSSVWEVIKVEYRFISQVGVLCNGALHWFMKNHYEKNVIVSFDLSKQEFKEIPIPNDSRYQYKYCHQLGIMNECLSIYHHYDPHPNGSIWIMNNYNVKQSWKLLPHHCEANRQVIHSLYEQHEPQNCNIPCESDKPFGQYFFVVNYSHRYVCAPIFVRSLVSPHVKARQLMDKKRKLSHIM